MSVAEVIINPLGFAYVKLFIRPSKTSLMSGFPYKVDTGANSTTINRKALYGPGYDDNWVKTVRRLTGIERPTIAAGGSLDECYIVALPEIHLGGYVGYNWPFLVSLNNKVQFRLLLGTDSLQFFNWEFDYGNSVCRFDLILSKRRLLFNQNEQSMHVVDGAM